MGGWVGRSGGAVESMGGWGVCGMGSGFPSGESGDVWGWLGLGRASSLALEAEWEGLFLPFRPRHSRLRPQLLAKAEVDGDGGRRGGKGEAVRCCVNVSWG